MQLLLDNIASVLIASTVLLVVVATSLNTQRSAVEASVAYAAKKQTLTTADFLEADLLLIGNGTGGTIDTTIVNETGQTTEFSFWRQDDTGEAMLVSYTMTPSTSKVIDGQTVQLYQLNRSENGVAAGSGSPTLSDFTITMLRSDGLLAASKAEARLLRVRAVNVYPFGDPDNMNMFRSYWGITVRPPNLET